MVLNNPDFKSQIYWAVMIYSGAESMLVYILFSSSPRITIITPFDSLFPMVVDTTCCQLDKFLEVTGHERHGC